MRVNIFIILIAILSINSCDKTQKKDKNSLELKKIFNFHLRSSDENNFENLSRVAFSDSIFVVYGSSLHSKLDKIEDTIRNSYQPYTYKKGKLVNELNNKHSKSYYDSIFVNLIKNHSLKTLTIQEFEKTAINSYTSGLNDDILDKTVKKFKKEKLNNETDIQFYINKDYEGVLKINNKNKEKTTTVSESSPEHFLVLQDITGDETEELFFGTIEYDYNGFRFYYCSVYQIISNQNSRK